MRATTYETIQAGVCDLIGWDADNLSDAEINQIKRAVTQSLERIWRDARGERIWDGTSEILRHIISRALLRPLGG